MRLSSCSRLIWLVCIHTLSLATSSSNSTHIDHQNVLSRPIEGLTVKDLVDSKVNKFLKRFVPGTYNETFQTRSQYDLNREIPENVTSDKPDARNLLDKASSVNVNFLLMGVGLGPNPPGTLPPTGSGYDGRGLGKYGPNIGFDPTMPFIPPPSPEDILLARGLFGNSPWSSSPPFPPYPFFGTRSPLAPPPFYSRPNQYAYAPEYPYPYGRGPTLFGPAWPII